MSHRTKELKQAWDERGERLGPTKRAVLFKRFPGWLNESIHKRHVRFIQNRCPTGAGKILDVGCGYGRISEELAQRNPELEFRGVDLCTEFANEYEKTIGPCFNGPIQEFRTDQRFDCILIVTTLMYLTTVEQKSVLQNLWSLLAPGGCIICIEPASELFILWRRLTGRESASPTGGTVGHFSVDELRDQFAGLKGARITAEYSVKLLPPITSTSVHHAIAVTAE